MDGKSNLRAALSALTAFLVYSAHDTVVKFLGGTYSPVQIVFFSVCFGMPLVTIMLMRDRTDGNLIPKRPWWTLLRTISALIAGVTAFYAFTVLPLAQAYAICFATPLLITLLAIPILGEKVGIHRGGAIVAGLIGVMIVIRPGTQPLTLGHGAALASAVSGALGAIIVRKIGREERSVVLILYPMMANFVVMGAALAFVYEPMPIQHLGLLAMMSVLSFAAMVLTISAYRMGEAVIVAPMQYSQIIWAALFGYAFFGEGVDRHTVLGAAVIVASGLYIVMREDTGASRSRPVTQSRWRAEVSMPRIGPMMRWQKQMKR